MFKKKITVDVLSKDDRKALVSDCADYDKKCVFSNNNVVRFANNESGDVLYVVMEDGISCLAGEDGDCDTAASVYLFDGNLEKLRGSRLPEIGGAFVPSFIYGSDYCHKSLCRNSEILGKLDEGKIYKKALKAVWKKKYEEYYVEKREAKKAMKQEQSNSFSARFFSAFKKSR